MTEPHETPDENEEAAERWLSAQHRHLVDHLDATLDVEAGLQDILLHSQHAALVERLDTEIDIEASLDAVLSLEKESISPETDSPPTRQSTDASASSILPAEKRIVLRAEPAVMRAHLRFIIAFALDRDLRVARALDRDLDLARVLALALDRAVDRAHDLAFALALAGARDSALDRALGNVSADTFDLAFASDLDRAVAIARAFGLARDLGADLGVDLGVDLGRTFDRALDRDRALASALPAAGEYLNACRQAIEDALGSHLPGRNAEAVEAFLDDFTDADLSDAKLNGVDLTGVLWSESGTCWPPGTDIEALKQHSTPQSNGIWVVGRGGGLATVRGSVEIS